MFEISRNCLNILREEKNERILFCNFRREFYNNSANREGTHCFVVLCLSWNHMSNVPMTTFHPVAKCFNTSIYSGNMCLEKNTGVLFSISRTYVYSCNSINGVKNNYMVSFLNCQHIFLRIRYCENSKALFTIHRSRSAKYFM